MNKALIISQVILLMFLNIELVFTHRFSYLLYNVMRSFSPLIYFFYQLQKYTYSFGFFVVLHLYIKCINIHISPLILIVKSLAHHINIVLKIINFLWIPSYVVILSNNLAKYLAPFTNFSS